MSKKKQTSSSLGKAIIKDRRRGRKGRGQEQSWLHSSELGDGYDWNRLNLRSVTEQSNLEEFLSTAELAGTEFTAEKLNIRVVDPATHTGLPTVEERAEIEQAQRESRELLSIPRRPQWDSSTTAEQLEERERESFLVWRRGLVALQEDERLVLTPFEKNLQFWRQLWRVVERSDVVVQIVDARNPLLFRCEDLEKFVKEVDSQKVNMLLISKADLLTERQREVWAEYFNESGDITVAFWSGTAEGERLKTKQTSLDEDVTDSHANPTSDSHFNPMSDSHSNMDSDRNRPVMDVFKSIDGESRDRESVSEDSGLSDEDSSALHSEEEEGEEVMQPASLIRCGDVRLVEEVVGDTGASVRDTLREQSASVDGGACIEPAGELHVPEEGGDSTSKMENSEVGWNYNCHSTTDVQPPVGSNDDKCTEGDQHRGECLPTQLATVSASSSSEQAVPNTEEDFVERESVPKESDSSKESQLGGISEAVREKPGAAASPHTTGKLLSRGELLELFLSISPVKDGLTTVGMVGYPNVGKSTTINTLIQEKKVPVSATPGRTKHFQTLYVSEHLMLCDCPGLVFPTFVTSKAEMICSSILSIDQMRDHTPPVSLVCQRIPRAVLERTYGIRLPRPGEEEDPERVPYAHELLGTYGYMRGFMTAHGVPDCPRGARYILKDYVNGKLLYCHPPLGVDPGTFNWSPAGSEGWSGEEGGGGGGGEREEQKKAAAKSSSSDSVSEFDKRYFKQEQVRAISKGVYGGRGFVRKSGQLSQQGGDGASVPDSDTASFVSSVSTMGGGKPWKKHYNYKKNEKTRRTVSYY